MNQSTDLTIREYYNTTGHVDYKVNKDVICKTFTPIRKTLEYKDKNIIPICIGTKTPVFSFFIDHINGEEIDFTKLSMDQEEDVYMMASFLGISFI